MHARCSPTHTYSTDSHSHEGRRIHTKLCTYVCMYVRTCVYTHLQSVAHEVQGVVQESQQLSGGLKVNQLLNGLPLHTHNKGHRHTCKHEREGGREGEKERREGGREGRKGGSEGGREG